MKRTAIGIALLALIVQLAIAQNPSRPSSRDTAAALRSAEFSSPVAEAVLARLSDAMQAHSLPQTKSLFDAAHFAPGFFDRMTAAFDHYESFRLYYHLASADPEKATVTADFRLESAPRQSDETPKRRESTLTLTFARVPQGRTPQWKIVAVDPANFLFEF